MPHTVAILDDFLRASPNGLVYHAVNRRWLATVTRSLGATGMEVREFGFDLDGNSHLDVRAFMAALEMDCGITGWAAAWDREPTDRFVALLAERLQGVDAVVAFGLSNVVATAVDRLGLPFLDVEVSPFRFQPDLDIDARTNVSALAESPLFEVPEARLRAAATAVRGWCSRHAPDVIPAGAGRVGVVFGQTELDASLIDGGRLGDFAAHVETLRGWADGLDHVLFRQHPYAVTTAAFELISGILPTIRPTRIGSYVLLASERVERFLTVSSGIIDEAAYFDAARKSTRLFVPKRRSGGFFYSPSVRLDVIAKPILEAMIMRLPIPAMAVQSYALRHQFGMAWGLPLEPMASDFYSPPPITDSQSEPEPCEPPTSGEPEASGVTGIEAAPTETGLAVPPAAPRRLSFRRKAIREVRRVVGQVAGALTAKDPPMPSEPPGEPEPVAKDFGYFSGERQTARFYFEIRRDHRARYELASRMVPRRVRVLDVFCGNGYGSFLLSDRREVLGVDGSADAIAVAERHYARLGARFEVRQFPFADDAHYDAVVSFESLEHVDDGPEFFRFLADRVAPGGLLLFSTPNQDLLPFDPTVFVHHRRHYGQAEALDLFGAAGLKLRTWFGQNVYRLDGSAPVPLHPTEMELQERKPGQFLIVVAEKCG